jgi:hypothetical protein
MKYHKLFTLAAKEARKHRQRFAFVPVSKVCIDNFHISSKFTYSCKYSIGKKIPTPTLLCNLTQSWIEINKFDDLGLIKHSLRLLLPEVDLPWFDNLTVDI